MSREARQDHMQKSGERDYGIQMKPNYDMPQGFNLKEPPSNATKTVYSILQQLVNLIPPLEFPKVRMKLNESVPAKTTRRFSCNAGCLVFVWLFRHDCGSADSLSRYIRPHCGSARTASFRFSQTPPKYFGYSATKINFSLEPPRPLCYTCTR